MLSGGEDYNTSTDQIRFSNGSIKGDRQCFNITIVDDLLLERNETFHINVQAHAEDTPAEDIPNQASGSGQESGSGRETLSVAVNVRGALNSSTGSVSVTIVDNDGEYACRIFCNIYCTIYTNFFPLFLTM